MEYLKICCNFASINPSLGLRFVCFLKQGFVEAFIDILEKRLQLRVFWIILKE